MSSSDSSQAYEATDARTKTSTTPKDKASKLPKPEKVKCPPAPKRPPPKKLDEKKYVPALIDFVLRNNRVYNYHVTEGLLERQVKEIWNVVKNEKALSLPVDLYCAVALTRLRAPPCRLLELPPDFLAKILKCLQVEDVARVSCVCKELQNLPNDECDDELRKQKLDEEYGTSLVKSIDQLYRYWIGEEDRMSHRISQHSTISHRLLLELIILLLLSCLNLCLNICQTDFIHNYCVYLHSIHIIGVIVDL
ncbi:hypothetical protein ACLB2K_040776 [Fragaria x ananassa]